MEPPTKSSDQQQADTSDSNRQVSAANDQRKNIRLEALRIELASLLAAERHYAAETPWYHWNLIIGIPSTVLAAVAGAAAFSKLANSEIVAGSISIVVAVLSGLITFVDPKKNFADHHASAKGYEALYHQAGLFYRVESRPTHTTEAELLEKLKELSSEFDRLNTQSQPISGQAYKHADAVLEQIPSDTGQRP
jgi:hypothetical protein